jgi:CRP/FNR family transcriptional regulator
MSQTRKVWYLRRLDLFASMTDPEIAELAALLDDHLVPPGIELLGSRRHDQVYLIKHGAVGITTGEGRRAVTVALLGPGRLFGLSASTGTDDPTIAATTLVPTYVCVATWGRLVDVMVRHPAVLLKLVGSLAHQVFQVETWRERHAERAPAQRLDALLHDLADEFGEPVDGGLRLPFRLSRADLARMVGLSRETTSRLMAGFERSGRVRQEAGRIVMMGPHRVDPENGSGRGAAGDPSLERRLQGW